jgi:hypothetical protein
MLGSLGLLKLYETFFMFMCKYKDEYGPDSPLFRFDCQVLPLHAQAKQSKIKAGTHVVLPMNEEEHALPMSTVHHVDGTQPMVDLLQSVRLRLNAGYV